MASVGNTVRVVPEFEPSEHEQVTEILAQRLDQRIERFDDDQVELEISVKERDTPSQRVVLECWVAVSGRTRFVGTSTRSSLMDAVGEAGKKVHTQVDRFVSKQETNRRG